VNVKKQPLEDRSKALARERLRRRYRPAHVKILFVGEAPPASGRFFYHADSGLYRAFRDTFAIAFPALDDSNFLELFRGFGCYLVDLCGRPVDRLSNSLRRKTCQAGEIRLSRILKQLRPRMVVVVVRSIVPNVRRSIAKAEWKGQTLELPYPGRWQQHRASFKKQLLPVLRKLKP
jgi:hypothetical protein